MRSLTAIAGKGETVAGQGSPRSRSRAGDKSRTFCPASVGESCQSDSGVSARTSPGMNPAD